MIDKNSLLFDKNKFANIIKQIKEQYESQEDFAKKASVSRTYLSQYMNGKLDAPPNGKTLQKIADASLGLVTYDELLEICGYKQIEDEFYKLEDGEIDFLFENGEDNNTKIEKTKKYIESIENYKKSLEDRLEGILKDPTMKLLYVDTTNVIRTEISLEEKRLKGLKLGLEKLERNNLEN